MLELRWATDADLDDLVRISIAAFQEDEAHKPDGAAAGGPPGHDAIVRHRQWLHEFAYLVCTQNQETLGACIVAESGESARIHGINVAPWAMNAGIGSWMLTAVQQAFPHVSRWWLETPDYARRNHHFYAKNGFECTGRTECDPALGFGFCIYEKRLSPLPVRR